jgi:hypothetical protein
MPCTIATPTHHTHNKIILISVTCSDYSVIRWCNDDIISTYLRDEAETEYFIVIVIDTEQHGSGVGGQRLKLFQGTVQSL